MVYSEDIKPKHRNRMNMPLTVFKEDLQLPYSLGFTLKPDNDSNTTLREIKYLSSLKTNKEFVEKGDDVKGSFLPLIEEYQIPLSETFVKQVIKESAKFIMKMKYHYNRPRPYQVAKIHDIDLNGTQLDSMKTPSYPSGHAVQGYLIAELFSFADPRNSRVYHSVGEMVAESRINAKAHYPSDKNFGKKVAKVLFQGLKVK